MKAFKTEQYTDFTKAANRKKMQKAIAQIESQFGKEYSIIIGGERIRLDSKFHSYNPSNKSEIIGTFQEADEKTADKALEVALETFKSWRYTPANVRANYLIKIAACKRSAPRLTPRPAAGISRGVRQPGEMRRCPRPSSARACSRASSRRAT